MTDKPRNEYPSVTLVLLLVMQSVLIGLAFGLATDDAGIGAALTLTSFCFSNMFVGVGYEIRDAIEKENK